MRPRCIGPTRLAKKRIAQGPMPMPSREWGARQLTLDWPLSNMSRDEVPKKTRNGPTWLEAALRGNAITGLLLADQLPAETISVVWNYNIHNRRSFLSYIVEFCFEQFVLKEIQCFPLCIWTLHPVCLQRVQLPCFRTVSFLHRFHIILNLSALLLHNFDNFWQQQISELVTPPLISTFCCAPPTPIRTPHYALYVSVHLSDVYLVRTCSSKMEGQ